MLLFLYQAVFLLGPARHRHLCFIPTGAHKLEIQTYLKQLLNVLHLNEWVGWCILVYSVTGLIRLSNAFFALLALSYSRTTLPSMLFRGNSTCFKATDCCPSQHGKCQVGYSCAKAELWFEDAKKSQLKFSWPIPWPCVFPLPHNIHSWFKPARFRFVWWHPWFSDQIFHVSWLCVCFAGTEGGWHGRGYKQLGELQCSFWSYTGLESSLNCLTQPWWGCPKLNLNLCKSYSCTHTELIWVMEKSTERWHWWKCLCELASGRKEGLPLL